MIQAKIIETNLNFTNLTERECTDMLVIHHTGSIQDYDFSAEKIHDIHLGNGWSGIGYHFVVRKNGDIERGRPEWAVGSHAYGENYHTIGIHLSGDFENAYPTNEQIESTAILIANLCEKYNIVTDRDHIKGHFEVDPDGLSGTNCPGKNLTAQLDTIVGKANWYRYDSGSEKTAENLNVEVIATISAKYESNGDPACVANNAGDLGGISYGKYQLASNVGAVEPFINWLCKYPDDKLANYGRVLAANPINSDAFISTWENLGTVDPVNFGKLQDEYMIDVYYGGAAKQLAKEHFNLEKHSDALKAVVFSRAVQNGQTGCTDLFLIACENLGHPNLSYIDDAYFDDKIISAIYDFLIRECDSASPDGYGVYRSPEGFCNGSKYIVEALRSRFVREKQDALNLLKG